jgi:hypothetical protein
MEGDQGVGKETKGNMEQDMMKRWDKELRTLYYTV